MTACVPLVLLCLAFAQAALAQAPQEASKQSATSSIDTEKAAKLLKVKRIYVEGLGDDAISKQLQAMLINALVESKRFIVTENKDKTDAILKGAGLEKTSQELHAIGEATAVGAAAGAHSGSISASASGNTASVSGSSRGGFLAKKMATEDAQASTETINEARLAVRLVSADGDVIWSTTQESKGAKYKGASADVADKIVKQLLWDLDKAEKQTSEQPRSR